MKPILWQLGWLVCAITRKHLRGKQYGMQVMQPDGRFSQMYQCSRCGAVWTRKLPKAKEAA